MYNLTEVTLTDPKQFAVQLTNENVHEWAENLNGSVDEIGILSFQSGGWTHTASAGDWLVWFNALRDIQVYSDKMFGRLYRGE